MITALQAEISKLLWTGYCFYGSRRVVFFGRATIHLLTHTPMGPAPSSSEVTTLLEGGQTTHIHKGQMHPAQK